MGFVLYWILTNGLLIQRGFSAAGPQPSVVFPLTFVTLFCLVNATTNSGESHAVNLVNNQGYRKDRAANAEYWLAIGI